MGVQVTPDKRKGLVSLYQDDQLMHFTWKDRSTGTLEDDLIIFPDDCEFQVMLFLRMRRNVTRHGWCGGGGGVLPESGTCHRVGLGEDISCCGF